jgi:hypothetical protein
MFAKKNPPFSKFSSFYKFLTIHALAHVRIIRNECIRKTQKNGKNRGKWAGFWANSGEMERNELAATCEHNYGATFSRS